MRPKVNKRIVSRLTHLVMPAFCLAVLNCCEQPPSPKSDCRPTPQAEIGPFYRPNAPVRHRVGKGYRLSGTVLSAKDCLPLPGARLEFWLVNSQGQYDQDHRATVFADRRGRYRFEANRPGDYVGRKPHIHIMVSAEGYERLIAQHYPRQGSDAGVFDLVLVPLPAEGG